MFSYGIGMTFDVARNVALDTGNRAIKFGKFGGHSDGGYRGHHKIKIDEAYIAVRYNF
jgi:opacity protein-like surface antigen